MQIAFHSKPAQHRHAMGGAASAPLARHADAIIGSGFLPRPTSTDVLGRANWLPTFRSVDTASRFPARVARLRPQGEFDVTRRPERVWHAFGAAPQTLDGPRRRARARHLRCRTGPAVSDRE